MTVDPSAETRRLRATVRDLLALTTIPEAWVGREPPAIAADLADLLIELLRLDFAFVRLRDPTGRQVAEVTRGNSWNAFPQWLQQHLAAFGQISQKEIVTNVSGVEKSCCGIVIPIGVNSERGLVAAASARSDFPDQIDQQLLSVAANNAATGFQNAFLINELRSAQEELRDSERGLRKARDELEFKVAERTSELRRSEKELRDVIDTIPAIVWSARPDGSNSYVNSRFVEYCGMPPEQIAGSGWHAATHPDDLGRHNAKWLACVASGEACENEVRFRHADGEYRWHLQRGVPLRDEAGNIIRWYGVLTDIEDRKRAEERIRQNERELRQLIDFLPQHVIVLDKDGRLIHANQMVLDYTGRTLKDVRGVGTKERIEWDTHPDDLERARGESRSGLLSGAPFEIERRALGKNGQYRWFLFRYKPILDEAGHIARWFLTATDIEDRKQEEEGIRKENIALREEIDKASMFEEIVGSSEALRKILLQVAKVASTDSTVLILGETGTGKELVARAIHRRSNRSTRAFIRVNCAAIPPALIASELFGHEKGAFTGALQRHLGRFESADGGTIFLDEVGELPVETQIALLRVLQEREFERVGGSESISVNVRVLAAANRDLSTAVAAGAFREDLFYRLNVFPIHIPPLRDRREDIPLLVEYMIERYGEKAGKKIRKITKETLDHFQAYQWPGNIRELQNVVERAVILCDGETLSVDETWLKLESHQPAGPTVPLVAKLEEHEKEAIESALAECQGRISGPSGAAAKLGIPRQTLESKIAKLGINRYRFKRAKAQSA